MTIPVGSSPSPAFGSPPKPTLKLPTELPVAVSNTVTMPEVSPPTHSAAIWGEGHADGVAGVRNGVRDLVRRRADYRDGVGIAVSDVDLAAIGGDHQLPWQLTDPDRACDLIPGGADDLHPALDGVGHVDRFAIRGDHDTLRVAEPVDHREHPEVRSADDEQERGARREENSPSAGPRALLSWRCPVSRDYRCRYLRRCCWLYRPDRWWRTRRPS